MAKKQPEQIERMAGSIPHPGRRIALEILTLVLFILFMLPFAIVLLNSMRTNAEIINSPVGFPENPANLFKNISDVWNNPTFNFLTSVRDSLIITIISLAVISIFSAMAAWVLVRNKTRWSNFLFLMYVAAMVIPFQVVMFPLLTWFKTVGDFIHIPLLRSYQGIIFAYLGFGEAMSIFIFHGFIKGVPLELEEAADIDGCSRAGTFFRIVFPLLQPVFVTVLVCGSGTTTSSRCFCWVPPVTSGRFLWRYRDSTARLSSSGT